MSFLKLWFYCQTLWVKRDGLVIKDASVSQIKRPIMVNKQALLVKQGGKEGGLKPIVMVEEYKVRLTSIHCYRKQKCACHFVKLESLTKVGTRSSMEVFLLRFRMLVNLRGEHRVMQERCNLLFPSFRKVCIFRLRLFYWHLVILWTTTGDSKGWQKKMR